MTIRARGGAAALLVMLPLVACHDTGPTGLSCHANVTADIQGASGGMFQSLETVSYVILFQGSHPRLVIDASNKDFSRSFYMVVHGVAGTGSFPLGGSPSFTSNLASYGECADVGFLGCNRGKTYSSFTGDTLHPGALVVTALDFANKTVSGTFTFSAGDGIDRTNLVTVSNGSFSGCVSIYQESAVAR